ncbi:hypothetical protein L7F22_026531 [Adiantum nelumboides]|nr:hypothetical protein [Adiantum nelumboides]
MMEFACRIKDDTQETYRERNQEGKKECRISTSSKAMNSFSGLAWKDVWVTVNARQQHSRVVLHGLTGYAEPGKILAIMGPSGSGKSTLLDALAGRLGRRARMTGEITPLNGSNKKGFTSGRSIAYVTQDDTLLGTLTVRETILYSANLRLPGSCAWPEKLELVEKTILEMGLSDSADTPVGNWHLRGLSGGEKRRLSIALEILTRPNLLFLDEPTSGLDSASAFFVTATLRRLARDGGRTLIASIHQPSSEVFALFDSLFLLSSGRTVYFGDRALASEHFSNAGYPCPPLRNPSDHYLCAINSDFDKVKSSFSADLESSYPLEQISSTHMTNILVDAFATSKFAHAARSKACDMLTQQRQERTKHGGDACKTPNASFIAQTRALTQRSFVNMRRDVGYYWLRLVIYIMLTTCIGSIYFRVGTEYQSIMARASCMSYVTGFLTFMSIGGFPSFVEDMKVFSREHLNGHYGVVPFVLANFLSSLPFLSLIAVVSSAICYFLVELHPGFSHFAYFILCLLACLSVVESLMMAVASVVPNFLMGIITGAGIQGMYQNDFLGLTFQPSTVPAPRIPGHFILRKMYQIDLSRSKWWNLSVLLAMIVGYRFLFLVMIKVSEIFRKYVASAAQGSMIPFMFGKPETEAKPHPSSPTSSSCSSSSPTSSSSSSPAWVVIPLSSHISSPGPHVPLTSTITSSSSVSSSTSTSSSSFAHLLQQACKWLQGTKVAFPHGDHISPKPAGGHFPTSTATCTSASSLLLMKNSSLNALP